MGSTGIILLNKEAGMSSAQAIARLKRALHLDRIGHAGTLDPMATGLLICLSGSVTRLADFAQAGIKRYSGTIRLGVRTSSDDVTGTILSEDSNIPVFERVVECSRTFLGEIQQIPPKVSAVKIDGERAYKKSRRDEDFEIKARAVRIDALDLWPTANPSSIGFRMTCSKGTYVRSVARDLGDLLGCGGALESLCREASGCFSLSAAKQLADISLADIQRWDILFPDLPRVVLLGEAARRVRHGDERALLALAPAPHEQSQQRAIYCDGSFDNPLGLLEMSAGRWKIAANIQVE